MSVRASVSTSVRVPRLQSFGLETISKMMAGRLLSILIALASMPKKPQSGVSVQPVKRGAMFIAYRFRDPNDDLGFNATCVGQYLSQMHMIRAAVLGLDNHEFAGLGLGNNVSAIRPDTSLGALRLHIEAE